LSECWGRARCCRLVDGAGRWVVVIRVLGLGVGTTLLARRWGWVLLLPCRWEWVSFCRRLSAGAGHVVVGSSMGLGVGSSSSECWGWGWARRCCFVDGVGRCCRLVDGAGCCCCLVDGNGRCVSVSFADRPVLFISSFHVVVGSLLLLGLTHPVSCRRAVASLLSHCHPVVLSQQGGSRGMWDGKTYLSSVVDVLSFEWK
jgi:hypothetical protein